MRKQKGFTLSELLIVVAVIALLVAIVLPIFNSQLHKARVAADWANIRGYYAQIQADFVSSGTKNVKVKTDWSTNPNYDWRHITLLNGEKVELLTGTCAINFDETLGYSIVYQCDDYHESCSLNLANN